jgi:hypothetical protein
VSDPGLPPVAGVNAVAVLKFAISLSPYFFHDVAPGRQDSLWLQLD